MRVGDGSLVAKKADITFRIAKNCFRTFVIQNCFISQKEGSPSVQEREADFRSRLPHLLRNSAIGIYNLSGNSLASKHRSVAADWNTAPGRSPIAGIKLIAFMKESQGHGSRRQISLTATIPDTQHPGNAEKIRMIRLC